MAWKENRIVVTIGQITFALLILWTLFGLYESFKKIARGFVLRPLWDCGYCGLPSTELFYGLAILGLCTLIPFLAVLYSMRNDKMPLHKRTIIVGIIVWASSFLGYGGHAFTISQIVSNFPRQQRVSEINVKGAKQDPDLHGMLAICDENGSVMPEMMLGLPSNIRGHNWQESQILVRIQRKEYVVGAYRGVGDSNFATASHEARQVSITATVIDNVAKSVLGEKVFVGGLPDETIRNGGGEFSGSSTGPDPDILVILNWIKSLHRD